MRMHLVKTVSMGRKRKADTKAGASQPAKGSGVAKEQVKNLVTERTPHVNVPFESKKMKEVTRRSQRIRNLAKPAGNENKTAHVYELEDSDSDVELVVREKSAEPVMEPPGFANGDDGKQKKGRPRKRKKTQEVVNKPQGLNDSVAAGRCEEGQQVNMPWEPNDGVSTGTEVEEQANKADQIQEVANKPVERPSVQNVCEKGSRYKTLYTKAMRRLEAVTEERNVLSRQLAAAEAKIGVHHDFRDQFSEVTEKLEVFNKTWNPQMADMLRDILTIITQLKPAEVSPNTDSAKDTHIDKATTPCTRSSKKSKRHSSS